ncbi:MAG: DUF4159 domain-containing protein [Paracoccus sp. (in: a-proteobacteria)]|nr:DUF4159 domain-containing protein [Paracoccus sp. (in: a-proteobacteria)]
MWTLGPIGFATPWLLGGLIALPLLWVILRAMPPAPRRISFPGTALLLGLRDARMQAQRTPWWLMLLRMLAAAAVIVALAGPVWRPAPPVAAEGPLLVVMDAGATAAPGWAEAERLALREIGQASAAGRPVALLLADGQEPAPVFATGDTVAARLRAATPRAWPGAYPPDPQGWLDAAPEGRLDVLWLADGAEHPGRADWLAALAPLADLRVSLPARPAMSLGLTGGDVPALIFHALDAGAAPDILALGPDPQGVPRELARLVQGPPRTDGGVTERLTRIELPVELRNRVTRFQLDGVASAAAVVLGDDALRRRKVGLVGAARAREAQPLLLPGHYVREALRVQTDLIEGGLGDVLEARPDVVILVDEAGLDPQGPLADFVQQGGLLIRFAGPRMAAAAGLEAEPLLPVRLRPGGRDVGGALSWGAPRDLAEFATDGPFAGLAIPPEVVVRAQLLPQPGPDLTRATIASLSDGTPLITRSAMGQGQVVLFHIGANAEWSSLPLSGLFTQMLARLVATAALPQESPADDQLAPVWTPELVLDGFGQAAPADATAAIDAEAVARGVAPGVPAGLYRAGNRHIALNAGHRPGLATWGGANIISAEALAQGVAFGGWLLLAGAVLLLLDALGSGWVMRGGGRRIAALAVAVALLPMTGEGQAQTHVTEAAQDPSDELMRAAREFALAYVVTGDAAIDETSRAGLDGISRILFERTTVEPSAPVAVDLERDDIALLSFLYWPVTASQPMLSPQAYQRLNRYLASGGMILFDTRDGDVSGLSAATGSADLRRLASGLDLPPLEQVPRDHVLARAYYLLSDFPGRYQGNPVWVEAVATDAEGSNLNDGVSPIVIGGNAWAEAWALDGRGLPRYPVGTGFEGERQREMANRFGVNLIMYVLTGNYKSDQVHIPRILERLRLEEAAP